MVYAYTSLMDRDMIAFWLEAIKATMGLLIIWQTGSWFKIDLIISGGSYLVAAYLFLSVLVVAYFNFLEVDRDSGTQPMAPS